MAYSSVDPNLPQKPRARAGFSMVEVIIAIVILTVGVLGLGGTTAYIVRQVTLADLMTERAAALQSVVERIQAMDFDSLDTGTDSVGVFAVSWSSTTEAARSKLVTIITTGPGLERSSIYPMLSANVQDTFKHRVLDP